MQREKLSGDRNERKIKTFNTIEKKILTENNVAIRFHWLQKLSPLKCHEEKSPYKFYYACL